MDKKNARKARQRKLRNRRIALTLCLMLTVAVASIGGTIAWLTASTTEVKNTFTPSTIDISLTETKPAGQTAEMVPGANIEKDPKVTVLAGSETCWVFIEVLESDNLDDFISYTVDTEKWTKLDGADPKTAGAEVYYYKNTVDANTANQELSILTGNSVSVRTTVTNSAMKDLNDATQPTLTFYAYAVQSENLTVTDMAEIWNLAKTAA